MSVQALREFINRHNAAAAGLAALGAVLDAKASGTTLDPVLAERIDELLSALGGGGLLDGVSAQEVAPFLAELRHSTALEAKLLYTRTRTTGWSHTEPEILQSVGDVSAGFVQPLSRMVVPSLAGLSDRLAAPGSAFLDVGVGVAGLSIAVARMWPAVQIVGIDPWQPSLALARDNVAKANLGGRIELREQRAEDLPDEKAFDLAWIPTPFMPGEAVRPACERVHRSLRPGGWMLVNAINPNFDPQTAALWRLRLALFGDGALPSAAAESLLRDIGAVDVHTAPSPPGAFLCLVAARRKPA